MTTVAQEKNLPQPFRVRAKKRMLDLNLTIQSLADELGVHRNSVSLALRHPAVLPDLHKKIATRLSVKQCA